MSGEVLCSLDDLSDGSSRGFDPAGSGKDSLFVVRRGDDVYVWADWCPHHGTPMAWRKDAYLNRMRDRIVCAAHGAMFEIDTGRCVLGPCLGDVLRPIPFEIDGIGRVVLKKAQRAQPHF